MRLLSLNDTTSYLAHSSSRIDTTSLQMRSRISAMTYVASTLAAYLSQTG